MKFGGTSVADAGLWHVIARLAQDAIAQGDRVVLVCSALAGVTNALQELARAETGHDALIDQILDRHAVLAERLGVDVEVCLERTRVELKNILARLGDGPQEAQLAELLAQGELMSSYLGQQFLALQAEAVLVDARDALRSAPQPQANGRRAWLSARGSALPDRDLQARWASLPPILVTQGFLISDDEGRTRLLGRGGSDTSAALFAAVLEAKAVDIWTDVPGLFTTDPRTDGQARLISALGYDEALELAASGAKVVHADAIRVAAGAGITIRVKDLSNPELPGSRILPEAGIGDEGVKAVTCQPEMLVLLLENRDQRQQVGFLARVFSDVSESGISIDLVATSETTTTLAINTQLNHLDDPAISQLAERLSKRCKVKVFRNCTCVNLVGRGARRALGMLGTIPEFFDQRPLLMLSLSANDLSLGILVRSEHAKGLVEAMHSLIIAQHGGADTVLGPSWNTLRGGA